MSRYLSPLWLNGKLIGEQEARLDVSERGFLLGDGVFETLPVFNGVAIDLVAHIDRLAAALSVLGLGIARSGIERAVEAVISSHPGTNAILRITVSRGPGGRGLGAEGADPTLLVTLSPWQRGALFQTVDLITSTIRRNEHSLASRIKSLSYIDNILAAREASHRNAGDALMLNGDGRVACTTVANVVVVTRTGLETPAPAEGALPGITVAATGARAVRIQRESLLDAPGLFLTNSIRLVRPVTSLDGIPLGSAKLQRIEEIFDMLCSRIEAQCGRDPRRMDSV